MQKRQELERFNSFIGSLVTKAIDFIHKHAYNKFQFLIGSLVTKKADMVFTAPLSFNSL